MSWKETLDTSQTSQNSSGEPAQNDPWSPVPSSVQSSILPAPANPRYHMTDSARYIQSLEKRLSRVRGQSQGEPTAQAMIQSMVMFKEDLMRHYMEKDSALTFTPTAAGNQNTTQASYFQRKLHPERRAVHVEELFELLKDDHLAKVRADLEAECLNLQQKSERCHAGQEIEMCTQDKTP